MLSLMARKYCIIGAGAAGLATLQALRGRGREVHCFEASDRVGGHWHTDYESLHLITSRDLSGFDGYPMPSDYPVYPSRQQMRAYLEAFARHHGLYEEIHFSTEVVKAEPLGETGQDGWAVETSDGSRSAYDAVLVANGHLWDPFIPTYDGAFTGRVLHSSQYRNIGDIAGSRVLTVGAGNSGCDLAVDAATSGKESFISVRHGQMFQPKAILGRPRAELSWLTRLPAVLQERATRMLVDVVLGPTSRYRGLPEPETRNLDRQRPVVNTLLPYWIQHGRIAVVPGIRAFDGTTVHFVDGSHQEIDTLLWATGFNVRFPFLDDALLRWQAGVPLRVAGLTMPLGLERLFFIGLAAPRGPQLPVYSAQAELVGRLLDLQDRTDMRLAEFFTARQPPDNRIDILRPVWQRQMDRTNATVNRLSRWTVARRGDRRSLGAGSPWAP